MTPLYRGVYPTHYISALEPHYSPPPLNNGAPDPVEIDSGVEYKIDRILNHKGEEDRRIYLVS